MLNELLSTESLRNPVPQTLDEIRYGLKGKTIIAIDTETTSLTWYEGELFGISLATDANEWFIYGDQMKEFLPELLNMFRDPSILWVGHNIKFDLHFLGQWPARVADTMIAQWVLDVTQPLGLKELAQVKLGIEEKLPTFDELRKLYKASLGKRRASEVLIHDLPIHVVATYAARDARLTYDLWNKLVYELDKENMLGVFDFEMRLLKVIWKMERNGMYIDRISADALIAEIDRQLEEVVKLWNEKTQGVNRNSTPQLRDLFFNRLKMPVQHKTETGQPAVDELALQRLSKIDHPGAEVAKILLQIRKLEKMRSTYAPILARAKPWLYGEFNPVGTETGRLSSNSPNLQNIPAHGEWGKMIRDCFRAPAGYKVVDIDYSQIELRLLAHDSGEPALIEVFKNGGDPHQTTADMVGVDRHIGKTLNFATIYGAGARTLCDTIEKNGYPRPNENDARRWLADFDKAYPKVAKYKQAIINRTKELGYVKTIAGRRRHLPDLYSPLESVRKGAERKAVNTRIQGSAADIMRWSMVEIDPLCDWFGAKMIAQVHDELVFIVPEAQAERFAKTIQRVMESAGKHFNLRVPIEASYGIGDSWASAKK